MIYLLIKHKKNRDHKGNNSEKLSVLCALVVKLLHTSHGIVPFFRLLFILRMCEEQLVGGC